MVCYRIQVFGRVQGVFYRASAKTEADKLSLNGWVKNESDGSVLIEAEGELRSVERFIEWCKQGPQFANVTHVDVQEIRLQSYSDFEVRY